METPKVPFVLGEGDTMLTDQCAKGACVQTLRNPFEGPILRCAAGIGPTGLRSVTGQ